jgi:hypothetical protein
MKQIENLIADMVREMHVDMCYLGHNCGGAVTVHVDKRRTGKTPSALWK